MADALSYFPLFYDQRELLEDLSGEEVKCLIMALFDYFENGVAFDHPDRSMRFAFRELRKSAELCASNYKKRCEINRQNGKKGGRPKTKTEPTETEENPNNPQNPRQEKEEEKEKLKEKEEEKEKEKEKKDAPTKVQKHKYGEYDNVLLTDGEFDRLRAEFPDYEARIQRLSEYIESKGAKYSSHYATIRAWARKDKQTNKTETPATYDMEAFDNMIFLNEVAEG